MRLFAAFYACGDAGASLEAWSNRARSPLADGRRCLAMLLELADGTLEDTLRPRDLLIS